MRSFYSQILYISAVQVEALTHYIAALTSFVQQIIIYYSNYNSESFVHLKKDL